MMYYNKKFLFFLSLLLVSSLIVIAQDDTNINSPSDIDDCVSYALKHSPLLKQSEIDREIIKLDILNKLSEAYPQIGINANLQRNFQLPAIAGPNGVTTNGRYNQSGIQLGLTQNIFNNDLLFAKKTAHSTQRLSEQQIAESGIDVIASVRKVFYSVLLTEHQFQIFDEDINRLQLSLKMAKDQYNAGVVDKVDYTRATIALNTSMTEKANAQELLGAKYAQLKELMGMDPETPLQLVHDTTLLQEEALLDTNTVVNEENRIEYQQLITTQNINKLTVDYRKNAFWPTISLYGNYNLNFVNDKATELFSQAYPNSYAGLQFEFPIFQGGKRRNNIRQAQFELERNTFQLQKTKSAINTEYQSALATYKSDWNNYVMLEDNLQLAKEVYRILDAQYKAGVKNYLEVVVAQTDLQKASINYANALYQLLIDKVDVEKAKGSIVFP